MGQLDLLEILSLGTGAAGIFDTQNLEAEADEANVEKFDEAGGRLDALEDQIFGQSEFSQLPQKLQDDANRLGGEVIKNPDGTYSTISGDIEAYGSRPWETGTIVSRDRPQGQTIQDIIGTDLEGREQIRENALGRLGDIESTIIPGFQNREQSILGDFANLQSGLNAEAQGRTETGMEMVNQLMASLQGGFGQLQSDVAGGFGTLRGDLLGALEGAGSQERIDINETFDNLGDATRAGLISSGLSGSTILPSLQADVARQRTGAQGRLEERLRGQELGVIGDTGFGALGAQSLLGLAGLNAEQGLGQFGAGLLSNLSGDALNLGQSLGIFGTGLQSGLSGDTLAAQERIGNLGLGIDIGTDEALLNSQTQLNQIPFDLGFNITGQQNDLTLSQLTQAGVSPWLMFQQLFQSFIPPETPDQPGTAESLAPSLIGAGTKGVALYVTAGAALPVCIDGNAILKMPDKPRMLKDIELGDKVLNSRGDYVEVVWKDYGSPAEVNEYVELSCGAYALIATVDHHIGGKAAGEWRIGEEMEFFNDKKCLVEDVKKVGPVLCGDIQLADGSDYIANGFVVTSQLVRVGAANDA